MEWKVGRFVHPRQAQPRLTDVGSGTLELASLRPVLTHTPHLPPAPALPPPRGLT